MNSFLKEIGNTFAARQLPGSLKAVLRKRHLYLTVVAHTLSHSKPNTVRKYTSLNLVYLLVCVPDQLRADDRKKRGRG